MLLVDRLLTESTLEAAIESQNRLRQATPPESRSNNTEFSSHWMDLETSTSLVKLEDCRICHEEDDNTNMEIPCSCRGSLKVSCSKIFETVSFWN